MEYLTIGLLIIVLILVLYSILKNTNVEKINKIELSLIKEIGDFKNDFSRDLNKDFTELNERIEKKLNNINEKVNERLEENFQKSNQTFTNILQRLTKIDEAQKKIDNLSTDIVSLQGILTDKKTRGIFGEVNLKHILANIFGERNDSVYRLQYTFNTRDIVDAVLFAPEPLGTIGIDSKFPLENYRKMVDKELSKSERATAEKMFKADVKKHIDAIATKYIIPEETTDQAIMFLPAEAIFAEVSAYHSDLIEYAYKKRVWITSPTTLISTLTAIQMILKNIERDKYTSIIHEELNKLGDEFGRYKERWDKLSRSIDTVNKDVKDIHITSEKISKRFNEISTVDMDKLEEK